MTEHHANPRLYLMTISDVLAHADRGGVSLADALRTIGVVVDLAREDGAIQPDED